MNFCLLLLFPLVAVASTAKFIRLCSTGDVQGCLEILSDTDRTAFEPALLAACENCHTQVIKMFYEQHKMPFVSKETRLRGLRTAISNNCRELVYFFAQKRDVGLYKVALQCSSLGNLEILKEIFVLDRFKVYRHRPGLIQLAIQGGHVEVVKYLLANTTHWPPVFVGAFKSACRTRNVGLIRPFLKYESSQYWTLDQRGTLLGLLSTGISALMVLAMKNESFVKAFEACDPVVIREVMYLVFLIAVTADHASLQNWYEFLRKVLDFHMLSGPITRLRIFDLAMALNRSALILPILHRCPNINLRSELIDDHYTQIISTRFMIYLLPFIMHNEDDMRYLMMCVAVHDYKERPPHEQNRDFESLYDYAKNVRRILMTARMSTAQHTYNISNLMMPLRLIDNDDEMDRLSKIKAAENSKVVERYLIGVHLICALYTPSDDDDFWLPKEIKHYIVKTYLGI